MDTIRLIEDGAWETILTFHLAAIIGQETLNAPVVFQKVTVVTGAPAINIDHVSWTLAPVAIPPRRIEAVG